jgi:hypothetical protein
MIKLLNLFHRKTPETKELLSHYVTLREHNKSSLTGTLEACSTSTNNTNSQIWLTRLTPRLVKYKRHFIGELIS